MQEEYQCPKCGESNPGMIDQRNPRREQVDLFCNVCSTSWVHKFNVPRENILPKEIKKP